MGKGFDLSRKILGGAARLLADSMRDAKPAEKAKPELTRAIVLARDRNAQLAKADPSGAPMSRGQLLPQALPEQNASLTYRYRFGRGISMDGIERALISANDGIMRDLTDLSRETVDVDPHLAAVLNKRFRALSSLPWELHVADGPNIDHERAELYAAVVREQLDTLRSFRQFLTQQAWALFDGRAVHEILWTSVADTATIERKEVTWAVKDFEWVHPRRINFGPYRELRVVDDSAQISQSWAQAGLAIDEESLRRAGLWRKFVWWCPQLFAETQEREGLARRCLYWSFFKRFAQRDRMILMELFGKPWRILEVPEESSASDTDLESADDILDALGASSTARFPRGTEMKIISPDAKSGDVHAAVVAEADKQISKLVLGQTGTTDAVPAGLNSNSASILRDEQLMLLQSDARDLSEIVQYFLTDAIVEVNFGAEALSHAPRFILRYDQPADRGIEIDRLQKALTAGMEIPLADAYIAAGIRQPNPGEARIRIEQPPPPPLSPVAPAPRPMIVYPAGQSPEAGEQQPPAATAGTGEGARTEPAGVISAPDQAAVVTVNEARAAQGLPPLVDENGEPDPDGNLTVEAYKKKHKGPSVNPFAPVAPPAEAPIVEEDQIEEAPIIEASKLGATFLLSKGFEQEAADDVTLMARAGVEVLRLTTERHIEMSGKPLPSSEIGDPESIVGRDVREMDKRVREWVKDISEKIGDADTAPEIYRRANAAVDDLDLGAFSRGVEKNLIRGVILGALDSANEAGVLKTLSMEKASAVISSIEGPFADAVKDFRARKVLPREKFVKLTEAARRKAFTVAGITSQNMLTVIHAELVSQVEKGADLREFKKWMKARLKSSGFIATQPKVGPLSAPHLETVARTNAANAYGAGRAAQQTTPAMLKLRPVWEISGVDDTRTRDTHAASHGKRLSSTDPFWQTCYPGFGFSCRCRVITRGPEYESSIVSGSTIQNLPDPGFVCGVSSLL